MGTKNQQTQLHPYAQKVLEELKQRYPWEQEFLQAVGEVLESIDGLLKQEVRYQKERILERIVEPERIITFKVPWRDSQGNIQVNRAYRVEFNSAIGPYKGGLRFHSSVTLSSLKFLGFEQIFKNSLTGLPMGGGKGGSDFDLKGKNEIDVMNFCQSFMTELQRHIGPDTDVPAGDIGVGTREIGYLFGQYKRIRNTFDGVLTGKGLNWGGSLVRPEATGHGCVYFVEEMLKTRKQEVAGKICAVSGFGNVSWGVVKKINDLGGKVVTLSGPDGFIYDKDGVKGEKIDYMLEMRASGRDRVEDYARNFSVPFYPGKRPWGVKCDIAFPCAIQNELNEENAKELLNNGCFCIAEGANMPVNLEAAKLLLEKKILYSPGKASNAGGVACSGLEMSQNSMRLKWTREEVDLRLKQIMKNIHDDCVRTAEQYGLPGNYVCGANMAGFKKVADTMIELGLIA
ncbi:MAG: NADP-specific glutamate dehydrogenase [Oligoflexia bacterium]|nr:NADP-specific glutamate dehydrogenase [Oligoflexia bacterium]